MFSELAREKMWARIHLTPLLQAEEDRDQVRRYLADKAREKELMGAETSPYHSDRCIYISPCHLKRSIGRITALRRAKLGYKYGSELVQHKADTLYFLDLYGLHSQSLPSMSPNRDL